MSIKKIIALLLSTILIIGIIAGCSNGDNANNQGSGNENTTSDTGNNATTGNNNQSTGTTDDDPEKRWWVSDTPHTIKILSEPLGEHHLQVEGPVHLEVQRLTNTIWEMTYLPVDDAGKLESFNLIMAGGEWFDIVQYNNRPLFVQYASEGAFMPLDDLIDQYAPYMKAHMDNPLPNEPMPYRTSAWDVSRGLDGQTYFAPKISAGNSIGAMWAIRQDWLNILNEPVPETIDDLYRVLHRMKDENPGGATSDVFPWTSGNAQRMNSLTPIVNAFGASRDFYIDSGNTIQFGPLDPNYYEGIQFARRMFDEGLADPDFLIMDAPMFSERVSNNQVGFMFGWPMSAIGFANNLLKEMDPSFKFVAMLPVASSTGARFKDVATTGELVVAHSAIHMQPEVL